MKKILEDLQKFGCDIDGALVRTLNDEEFLIECIEIVVNEQEFGDLGAALDQKQVKSAFENAHALKGVLENVGLSPLHDSIVKIVERLRAGHIEGLNTEYIKLIARRDEIKEILIKNGAKV